MYSQYIQNITETACINFNVLRQPICFDSKEIPCFSVSNRGLHSMPCEMLNKLL